MLLLLAQSFSQRHPRTVTGLECVDIPVSILYEATAEVEMVCVLWRNELEIKEEYFRVEVS